MRVAARTRNRWTPGIFEAAAREAGFVLHESQRAAALRLSRLGTELSGRRAPFTAPPRGIYVWGPVGRGKSWLVDTFYAAAPTPRKRRMHFHEFFREFHTRYAAHRGERAAGDHAVAELLGDCRLVCFDEFHVHDPGDATILARVLDSLFVQRITLVATSNYPPAGLLPNPLFHHLVEPVAAALEAALDIVAVAGDRDYRQAPRPAGSLSGFRRGRYLWPGTAAQLADAGLAAPEPGERRPVDLGTRTISARAVRGGSVWFDFADLCDAPYATIDYLELADRFPVWTLSGIPPLASTNREAAQRFANLVDVLCDRDITVDLIAPAPLPELLTGELLPPDIARTASRLALLSGTAPIQ